MREKLDKISTAIIGATGAVGQRFVQLLTDHPWFNLDILAASGKSAGNKYKDIVNWSLEASMPVGSGEKTVYEIDSQIFKKEGIELIFSALPANIAGDIETALAKAGFLVFSNASAHRMAQNVPLLIADVNPEHIRLIEYQRKENDSGGYIVTNPNCSVTGLATALKPLAQEFGIKSVNVTTYQALSGAGYPGVPSTDIIGNILPYIPGEEDKMESECNKILGRIKENKIEPLSFEIIANCARVPVRDGHLEAVLVELDSKPSIDEIKNTFANFNELGDKRSNLPTMPQKTIIVMDTENRPQPILDANSGSPERARGMAITIGRIKAINNKLRFFLLVHNTIRGAAGCSIMNAELAKIEGYL